ncbi:asparaginase domain-containing protein [Hyphococcus sp.]|uniref:asparaginase domain-containing protein n=1 Tax=Hyphococcus sp. TaxID=2038636 RepID=UPI003D10CCC9
MSTKLAIITTGGTIGSVIKGQTVGVDDTVEKLQQEIARICQRKGANYEVFSPINKNSEDLEPGDWAILDATIRSCKDRGYNKFVITHGTDTLSYTASAIGITQQIEPVKICFTGSFYSMDHEETDAPINLLAAFESVLSDNVDNGVYVAFREDERNRTAGIYRALGLKPMAFDDVAFRSVYDTKVAHFSRTAGLMIGREPMALFYPKLSVSGPLEPQKVTKIAEQIVILRAYPGLTLAPLEPCLFDCAALVIQAYHSGTANSVIAPGTLTNFISKIASRIPVLIGAFPSRYISTPYDSTARLIDAGAHVYSNLQPHNLYTYLVIGMSQGMSARDVLSALEPNLVKIQN